MWPDRRQCEGCECSQSQVQFLSQGSLRAVAAGRRHHQDPLQERPQRMVERRSVWPGMWFDSCTCGEKKELVHEHLSTVLLFFTGGLLSSQLCGWGLLWILLIWLLLWRLSMCKCYLPYKDVGSVKAGLSCFNPDCVCVQEVLLHQTWELNLVLISTSMYIWLGSCHMLIFKQKCRFPAFGLILWLLCGLTARKEVSEVVTD